MQKLFGVKRFPMCVPASGFVKSSAESSALFWFQTKQHSRYRLIPICFFPADSFLFLHLSPVMHVFFLIVQTETENAWFLDETDSFPVAVHK